MLRFVDNVCCLNEERGAWNGERRNENETKQGMKLLMELGFNYGSVPITKRANSYKGYPSRYRMCFHGDFVLAYRSKCVILRTLLIWVRFPSFK